MTKKQLSNLDILRYSVSRAFLNLCEQENERYFYKYSQTRIEIDINIVKLAMINNIEGAFIEKYGLKQGHKKATAMYGYMFSFEPPVDKPEEFKLTRVGIEMMSELFIHLIDAFESNGFQIPKPAVLH